MSQKLWIYEVQSALLGLHGKPVRSGPLLNPLEVSVSGRGRCQITPIEGAFRQAHRSFAA